MIYEPGSPLVGEQMTRRSARDIAYLQVRQLVAAGKLEPGAFITEKELAARVGVSRTPLREIVSTLESEGYVTRLPNGRLKVVPLTARELQELFSVRAAIERLIVASVAREGTDEEIRKVLGPIASGIRRGLEAHFPDEVGTYGMRLHGALAEICGNGLANSILLQLQGRSAVYRSIGRSDLPERRMQAAREHLQIYELVAAHRTANAADAMEEHIAHSQSVALRFIADADTADDPVSRNHTLFSN